MINNRIPVTKVLTMLKDELKIKGVASKFQESIAQLRVDDESYPTVHIVLAAASFPVWPLGRTKLTSLDLLPYYKVDPSSEGNTKQGTLEKFVDCLRAVHGEFNIIEVQDNTILFTGVFRKISNRDLDCFRFHCRVSLGVQLDDVTQTGIGLHDKLI